MSRTRLFDVLRRSAALALDASRAGIDATEHLEATRERVRISRRSFLKTSAIGAAALAVPVVGLGCKSDAIGVSIGIVGAGMAGLHCAYRLKRVRLRARVFDAATRTGGRMFTARGMFADGQICELGGELIDTGHTTMHDLATELGVVLDDLKADEPAGFVEDTFFIDGRIVTESEIVTAFTPLAAKMQAAVMAAEADPAVFMTTDNQSIAAWLDAQPEATPMIKRLLEVAYLGEYGLEVDNQSVFNLFYLVDYDTPDPFRIFGDSDERYHVHTGNDTLTSRLAAELDGQIELDARLMRIAQNPSGSYKLTFARASGTSFDATFDHVVLALPFTLLREVEVADGIFTDDKKRVIAELGYGTNAKLMGQFTSRVWRTMHNASGTSIVDNDLQATWDTSRGQSGDSGLITNFVGGNVGVAIGMGTPEERMQAILPLLEQVFPGVLAAYRPSRAVRMHWPSAPFQKGSYASYLPGQWSFQGTEIARAGNIHFAGEHCSVDYQGFMEGACATGAAAASEILTDLGLNLPMAARRVRGVHSALAAVRSPVVRRRALTDAWRSTRPVLT